MDDSKWWNKLIIDSSWILFRVRKNYYSHFGAKIFNGSKYMPFSSPAAATDSLMRDFHSSWWFIYLFLYSHETGTFIGGSWACDNNNILFTPAGHSDLNELSQDKGNRIPGYSQHPPRASCRAPDRHISAQHCLFINPKTPGTHAQNSTLSPWGLWFWNMIVVPVDGCGGGCNEGGQFVGR